jgi:hypothetical protein
MNFGKLGGQVKRQIFERDKRIEFEQLKMNAEKLKQLIIAKTLLHLFSLHKHVSLLVCPIFLLSIYIIEFHPHATNL